MTTTLRISENLNLPIDAVTSTFAILAKKGAGKTYLASVMAEEMLAQKMPCVIVDPTGAWFGLRSSSDGKSPGYPIVVFGGDHADLPLEDGAGEVVAASIVENRFSAVIDVSLMRKAAYHRFMSAFGETLYRLNREPVHLFVDEADAFAPQRPMGEDARTLGAMEDIVRRGRKRGIGCTLITQRPAVLNKNVLTQADTLFALRLSHPRDIDAVMEWINVHAEEKEAKDVIESLPTMPIGEAWCWSPGWLGILKRIRVRQRQTFDSSATPKPGQTIKTPKKLAEVDLAALGEQIQATVARAKENDPKELRRQIADLKKQLAARPAETIAVEKEVRVEVPVLKNGQLDRTEKILTRVEEQGQKLLSEAAELRRLISPAAMAGRPQPPRTAPSTRPAFPARPAPPKANPVAVMESSAEGVSKPQQKILDTLATLEGMRIAQPSKDQLALWCEVSTTSGGYFNNLGALRSAGLIEYPAAGTVCLTDTGRTAAHASPPMTTNEMHEALFRKVGTPKAAILRALIEIYPGHISKNDLADQLGVSRTSGGYFNNLGNLRTLGLVDYPAAGAVMATQILFLE